MTARKVYHVEPTKDEAKGWDIKQERGAVVEHHNRKDEAVMAARRLAKAHPLAQLKIHDRNGRIEEERTYGKDPHRTPG